MTIKKETYSYLRGLDTDSPPSKRGKDVYSMLKNGRITSSYSSGQANNIGSDGLIRCANGNTLVFEFNDISNVYPGDLSPQDISITYNITHGGSTSEYTKTFSGYNADLVAIVNMTSGTNNVVATYSDGVDLYLLTVNTGGINCIWKYTEGDISATNPNLLYANNLGWDSSYTYDIVLNHESATVKRMYIADGVHQVFSVNLAASNIMTKPKRVFYMVPSYSFSQPVVSSQVAGGNHTAGYIQYSYNLFNVNGGQTNVSPLSEMTTMSRFNGGGDVNEVIGKSNVIQISDIDSGYDYLRLYSIKYNDLNTVPTVSIVGDYAIHASTTLKITDNGVAQYQSSIEQFQFLGGTELVPRCIVGKKNRLIIGNIQENPWDLNNNLAVESSSFFDSRCFSVASGSSTVTVEDDAVVTTLDQTSREYNISGSAGEYLPITHDAKQDKLTVFYSPTDGTTPGGEGRHMSYTILQTTIGDINSAGYDEELTRYMKCGETYRWAIQFYNNRSQKSTPQWIADVRVPVGYQGFKTDKRVTIQFVISSEGHNRLEAQGVIGYKFLRVERTDSDKSIVAQGIVSPMIFQVTGSAAKVAGKEGSGSISANNAVKISSPWIRHFQSQVDVAAGTYGGGSRPAVQINACTNYGCISPKNPNNQADLDSAPWAEIYRDADASPIGSTWLHWSYQDTRIMQLFSPETIFSNPVLTGGMKVRVVGSLKQAVRKAHGKLVYTDSSDIFTESTSETTTTLFSKSAYNSDPNNGNYLNANGYIGPNKPTFDLWRKTEQLIAQYREYDFERSVNYEISLLGGAPPELAKHDTQTRIYNGNPKYKYKNTLQDIIADGRVEDREGFTESFGWDIPLFGVDALATQNITFVEAADRPLETIATSALSTISSNDHVLLMEVYRDLTDQYGGSKYEDRTLNKYIEVGEYNPISVETYNIIDNGDTFVGDFTFARIARIGDVSFNYQRMQMSEMVKFPVETSINIFNRSDNSYAGWEAQFLPTNESFHKYNSVFSQEANAIYSIPDPYLFTKNTQFSNRILASKPKVAGETIDSWLDILPNEELYLEGEYGPINRLLKLNDNLYSFQRDGVAIVSVLPRVQIQGSDAIGIELGVGQVLNTYQYLNTQSGCEDFNGVISTSSSIYYADRIRRSINMISSGGLSGLSDKLFISSYVKGFDTTFDYKPRYTLGFDPIADDVLFAIRAGYDSVEPDSEVLFFSENNARFTGIFEFSPEFLFTVDGKLHSIPTSGKNEVWSHFTNSNSCNFYGTQKSLELTICLNPDNGTGDCIFNTVEWVHDVYNTESVGTHYNSDNKAGSFADSTDNITYLSVWNDYLANTTADVSDIKRRFRISRLHIPRASNYGISRMRGQYLFLKMKYTPSAINKSILLSDITLYFNSQRS